MIRRVAIIGGGASGLMAAILLARRLEGRAQIAIFERCDRVGKKLLATGNGRCNISNLSNDPTRYHSVEDDGQGAETLLRRFDASAAIAFFESLGVVCVEEDESRVYPASGQASSVLDLMRMEMARLGVEERTQCDVTAIVRAGDGTPRYAIETADGNPSKERFDAVLVAAGGEASPQLGSNGSGFALMRALGHRSTPRYPAIVPLETDKASIRALTGIKFVGGASVWQGDPRRAESICLRAEEGEVLFADYGLSGPPILQLAEAVGARHLRDPEAAIYAALELQPGEDKLALVGKLTARRDEFGHMPIGEFFTGWLNKRIGQTLMREAACLPLTRMSASLTPAEIEALAALLKCWPIRVLKVRGFAKAQVTAGGIPLSEFTAGLESRFAPGVFAAGEMLDVHGDCGGFNLQWAWASAHTAAAAMGKALLKA